MKDETIKISMRCRCRKPMGPTDTAALETCDACKMGRIVDLMQVEIDRLKRALARVTKVDTK